MKTIVQVVQHLQTGGIEVMALELCRLRDSNTCMYIISLEGDKNELIHNWPRLEPFSSHIIALGKPAGWDLGTMRRLAGILREIKADAVHTHHIGPLIYGGIAAKMAGIKKHVHTEHDAWHLENTRRRRLEHWALRLLKPILIADSSTVASALQQYLPGVQTDVVLNGVDTDLFTPGDKTHARRALGLPQHTPLIGCAGRFSPEKGQRILIEALHYLPSSVCIAFAGDGALREELENKSRQLGFEQRVYFLGRQSNMPLFYQALDVFCLPSLNEGMPLAPLEAQACGIPTVMSRVGAYKESLCPNSSAHAHPGDAGDLAMAIKRVLRQQNSRESARAFTLANASAHLMCQRYHELCVGQEA